MHNVSFFLTPKQEVVYINEQSTMRQAMERMEYHGYTAVPTMDEKGHYVRTLTEGDLLWKMKNDLELTFLDTSRVPLSEVISRRKAQSVSINAMMDDLLKLALAQNFVPVVDDSGVFIGIVTRSTIIRYLMNQPN